MLGLYLSCSIVAMILLIWFRTEAFVEYCRIFNLNRFSFYKEYDLLKKEDASLTYHGYLLQYHNNFFTRLITCPICTSVWVAGGLAIISLKACTLPASMIGGLILYLIIDRLLG